jgi:hypothetical protein
VPPRGTARHAGRAASPGRPGAPAGTARRRRGPPGRRKKELTGRGQTSCRTASGPRARCALPVRVGLPSNCVSSCSASGAGSIRSRWGCLSAAPTGGRPACAGRRSPSSPRSARTTTRALSKGGTSALPTTCCRHRRRAAARGGRTSPPVRPGEASASGPPDCPGSAAGPAGTAPDTGLPDRPGRVHPRAQGKGPCPVARHTERKPSPS